MGPFRRGAQITAAAVRAYYGRYTLCTPAVAHVYGDRRTVIQSLKRSLSAAHDCLPEEYERSSASR